jgi:hypothetical protein
MFPAIVLVQAEIDLDERTPFRALGLADEMHAGFEGCAVAFECIALDTGANDVLPCGRAAAVTRDDVVKIEVFAVTNAATVLAGVLVALENIMPGEFDFLLGQAVKSEQEDHLGNADAEGNGLDTFGLRFVLGQLMPVTEAKGLEGTIFATKDGLGMSLKEQGEGASGSANVHGLPQTVEYENMLVQHGTHNYDLRRVYKSPVGVNVTG